MARPGDLSIIAFHEIGTLALSGRRLYFWEYWLLLMSHSWQLAGTCCIGFQAAKIRSLLTCPSNQP